MTRFDGTASKLRLRFVAGGAMALISALLAAPSFAQDMPAGAQTASSAGGVYFDGSVPSGPMDARGYGLPGTGNFAFVGVAPRFPAAASGPGRPGDPDMARPWVMFKELTYDAETRYYNGKGCTSFVNPDTFVVSATGRSVAFDVNCEDGRGYDRYHVTIEAPNAGPATIPMYWSWGGYKAGEPKFWFSYLQREWGPAKVRVCGVGGDGHCFERPPGTHPGGQMVTRSESMTVVEYPSARGGLL